MEHDLVLEGKVVRPSGVEEMQVGVSEGKIAELGRRDLKGARRIRAGRSLIFPGFVDLHVHLREPGWEHKEDFRTGTRASIHGGVTTLVDMPNNPEPATTARVLKEKTRLARAKGLVDVKFYGGVVAGSLGALDEIRDLVVGYKIYLARTTGELPFPEEELPEALARVGRTKLPLSLHCERQSVIDRETRELVDVDRADAHCDMRPPRAEVESVAGVVAAVRGTRETRVNVCHASTAQTLALVANARREGAKLDCEASLHHLFFDRRAMLKNKMLRTNPPLRGGSDRAAMVAGIRNGAVSFLVTDHAPHTEDEKVSLRLSGVPGLDDYGHLVSWLIGRNEVDPVVIGKVASSNPAAFAGLKDRGEIELGRVADFTVLDMHSPEKVRSDDVRSKCGWSPYEGVEFPGRVRWTVRRGETLLEDFELAV